MPAIILGIKIEDKSITRGLSRRWAEIQKQAMLKMAEYWHDEVFPEHFGSRNRSKYNFEPRRDFYLNVIKKIKGDGVGKYRDDVLSGQSQRWMQVFCKITGSSKQVTVRMAPPTYFTNPFKGTFTDPKTGKSKTISHQPDKPAEVTRFVDEDREKLRAFVGPRLVELIKAATPSPEVTEIN